MDIIIAIAIVIVFIYLVKKYEYQSAQIANVNGHEILNNARWAKNFPLHMFGSYQFDTSTFAIVDTYIIEQFLEIYKVYYKKMDLIACAILRLKGKTEYDPNKYPTLNITNEILEHVKDALEKRSTSIKIPIRCCTVKTCPEFLIRIALFEELNNRTGLPIPTLM
jgi:hypothetical protein